ncbi:NifU N-terminal domain-containing protein [Paenibacillus woosongensis]|uniref:NifU N-terminal domain-containing protein n=1 Tax=Paenibacillus woosongensis TaxID=307580 RepID=A0AA95ICB5_9BACL|nr:NifU N-terminal domain-containing protein [Paenibacillus woosongensis]WHX50225.1 NifU N-terminal domain-containing protein [Paenibacillus woosongensis]
MALEVDVQATPNPNAVKISANETLFEGTRSISLKSGEETDHPLASALLGIEGVDNIFGLRDFVTITKKPEADWDPILEQAEEVFKKIYG